MGCMLKGYYRPYITGGVVTMAHIQFAVLVRNISAPQTGTYNKHQTDGLPSRVLQHVLHKFRNLEGSPGTARSESKSSSPNQTRG